MNDTEKSSDVRVLSSVFSGASAGTDSIENILPKVESARLRTDLEAQVKEYSAISAEAAKRLVALGTEPESTPALKKVGMKLGTEINTLFSDSSSHIAELMIQSCGADITAVTKALNSFPPRDGASFDLAQRLIDAEHGSIERLKTYL